MNELISALIQVAADAVSRLFVIAIVVVFTVALAAHLLGTLWRARIFHRLSAAAPTLCTTIGVLGTFAGIFIGLLNFDVARIDESVPQLLLGLKIAFGTSIVGMSAAIAFKLVQVLLPLATGSVGANADDIHSVLLGIQAETRQGAAGLRGEVEGLRRAISSEAESSLLSQLQKLRLEVVDGQRELIAEFRSFAATIAENSSKALIQALEQVIRDFNEKLTEQFGGNFKKLNEAVGALLTWQENYRAHIDKIEAAFMLALDGLGRAEQALGAVKEHTTALPEAAKEIGIVVADVRTGVGELSRDLKAFAEMREKAIDAFPVIEGNITRLTGGFSDLVSASMREAQGGLAEHREAFGSLHRGYSELAYSATGAQAQFAAAIETTLSAIRQQLDKALHEHGRMIESAAEQMQADIGKAWKQTEEAINGRMGELDKQLQDELNRAMRVFGQNLAGISEKFVSDYTPLTQRLHELIQVAQRV